MCGRYTLTNPELVLEELGVAGSGLELAARFNIAPTQMAPVVLVRDGERVAELHRFGLVPSWSKSLAVGTKFLNARCETAASKPAFRNSLAKRRCLVATDGFLEWKREGKARIPFWFRDPSRAAVPLAGMWERWKGPDGWVLSFSILTAPASDPVGTIHDRMPIILDFADHERWLEPELPTQAIEDLLATPQVALSCTEVNRRVNNVHNDDPECLRPPPQGELF